MQTDTIQLTRFRVGSIGTHGAPQVETEVESGNSGPHFSCAREEHKQGCCENDLLHSGNYPATVFSRIFRQAVTNVQSKRLYQLGTYTGLRTITFNSSRQPVFSPLPKRSYSSDPRPIEPMLNCENMAAAGRHNRGTSIPLCLGFRHRCHHEPNRPASTGQFPFRSKPRRQSVPLAKPQPPFPGKLRAENQVGGQVKQAETAVRVCRDAGYGAVCSMGILIDSIHSRGPGLSISNGPVDGVVLRPIP